MKLTDLNRDGGIGANSHFLEIGEFKILIDAGMHPKKVGREATPDFRHIYEQELDLIILTHCHLDHLGALPVIMRDHPETPVVMSVPSRTLGPRMLHNSVNVMLRQREELKQGDLPLYQHGEIDGMEGRMFALNFNHPRNFHKGEDEIQVTLYPAGHVAGAASVKLVHKHRKIFISGDVLFTNQRVLPGAKLPDEKFDTVIIETTRGANERRAENIRESEVAKLLETINQTIAAGGSCLVPVFALGRMQEILTILWEAKQRGELGKFPIYSTGLGIDLCNYFDEICRKTGLVKFRRHILKDLGLQKPGDITPGRAPSQPGLYVVSSGMMVEHTPSYRLAASLLGQHKNSICFVGYCDPDTPGGQLLATPHGSSFLFEAIDYSCEVKARIEQFDMSGHADREELRDYALSVEPRAIVLTHGDPEARAWFMKEFAEKAPDTTVLDPIPLQQYIV